MLRIRPVVLLGLTLAACAHPLPRGQAHGPPVPSQLSSWFGTYDRVALAAGLVPLRQLLLAEGEREVRVWIGGGVGYPQTVHRFRERNGVVRGAEIRYWPAPVDNGIEETPGQTFHDLMLRGQRGACRGFRAPRGGRVPCPLHPAA